MVKQRMTAVDIAAEVACLRNLIGFRCSNVYDLNPKTYVVKLAKSSGVTGTDEGEKRLLLLESGVRFHTTKFSRDKSDTPSGFTLKLRKHIRTRRLEDVQQRGIDRVVDFQFGVGENAHHLLLELYASGNVILTGANYNILTLLRSHRDDDKGIQIMSQHPYPLDTLRDFAPTPPGAFTAALEAAKAAQPSDRVASDAVTQAPEGVTKEEEEGGVPEGEGKGMSGEGGEKGPGAGEKGGKKWKWGRKGKGGEAEGGTGAEGAAGGKAGSARGVPLRALLGDVLSYGAPVCDHILTQAGLDPHMRVGGEASSLSRGGEEARRVCERVEGGVEGFESWLAGVKTGSVIPPGFIFCHREQASTSPKAPQAPRGLEGKKGKKGKKVGAGGEAGGAPGASPGDAVSGTPGEVQAEEGEAKGEEGGRGEGEKRGGKAGEGQGLIYDEFWPLRLQQLHAACRIPGGEDGTDAAGTGTTAGAGAGGTTAGAGGIGGGKSVVEFDTFDACLDEFFSRAEGQRAEQQRRAAEQQAVSKLEKIKADQHERARVLEREVEVSRHKAELITLNAEDVDAAIAAVREELASGMDWARLWQLIKEERRAGNPVAGLVHSMNLAKGKISLMLSGDLDSMDEDEKTAPVQIVEVDITQTAFANARLWYSSKKKQEEKKEKTVAAHDMAFKAAEKKTLQQLAQAKTVASVSHVRKTHWFEKFRWFVSSENYLVISGRDAQQNELLVKRYLKKGDLYVHADIHGAASTVIKNTDPLGQAPIPPLTLNQAGAFTMCLSQAWDAKIVTSAWWVHHHQVSKSAPTGEYLTVGSFMIRGKKNFLPPVPLVLGFGFLFRLDQSSLAGHRHERRVRGAGPGEGEGEGGGKVVGGVAESGSEIAEEKREEEEVEGDSIGGEPGDGDDEEEGEGGEGEEEEEKQEEEKEKEKGHVEVVAPTEEAGSGTSDAQHRASAGEEEGSLGTVTSSAGGSLGTVTSELSGLALNGNGGGAGAEHEEGEEKEEDREEEGERGEEEEEGGEEGGEEEGDDDILDRALAIPAPSTAPGGPSPSPGGPSASPGTSAKDAPGAPSARPGAPPPKQAKGSGKAAPQVRGKRGKVRKVKEKYGEQDEEERQLRMALLASAGGKAAQKRQAKLQAQSKGAEAAPAAPGGKATGKAPAAVPVVCYVCKRRGHLARDCPAAAAGAAPGKAGSAGAGRGRTGAGAGDAEGAQRGGGGVHPGQAGDEEGEGEGEGEEGGAGEGGEGEREKVTEVDELTGVPQAGDILLYAVPMCGPLNAVQNWKYRVKLTPGHMKKGKAVKASLDVFLHNPELTPREKELIKAVGMPELTAAMMGNVKVTAPGLAKITQQSKASRRGAKKG